MKPVVASLHPLLSSRPDYPACLEIILPTALSCLRWSRSELKGSSPPWASVWGAQSFHSVSWKAEGWARAYHGVMLTARQGLWSAPALMRWVTFERIMSKNLTSTSMRDFNKGQGLPNNKKVPGFPSVLCHSSCIFLVYPFKQIVCKKEESVSGVWGVGGRGRGKGGVGMEATLKLRSKFSSWSKKPKTFKGLRKVSWFCA